MSRNINDEIEALRGMLIWTKINLPNSAKRVEASVEHEIARLQKERSYQVYSFQPQPTYPSIKLPEP